MTLRWRGRTPTKEQQVANARDNFVNLDPASAAPAQQVHDAWSALRAGQEIPLIGEDRRYGYREEDDDY
jgi:hypothetical protein